MIIHRLVGMLYDRDEAAHDGKGGGGEEQAAGALANLASDSDANRNSIVDAGGISPLLALLESASAKVPARWWMRRSHASRTSVLACISVACARLPVPRVCLVCNCLGSHEPRSPPRLGEGECNRDHLTARVQ